MLCKNYLVKVKKITKEYLIQKLKKDVNIYNNKN